VCCSLPETDDLSSSVILGELTDNLASGDPLSLVSTGQSTSPSRGLAANVASPEAVLNATPQNEQPINILPADILMGVDPSEVNSAIIVPGLHKRKAAQKAVAQVIMKP